jgi:hypothetical protein
MSVNTFVNYLGETGAGDVKCQKEDEEYTPWMD